MPKRLVAAALVLLTACQHIPEVTRVPVPAGPTVFHGPYGGTLTEGLSLIAATPSADGARLYAAARTSAHTTLLVLDLTTGRELRRGNVPVAEPQDLALRGDGVIVLAGRTGSATLDPETFEVRTTLPGAVRVSADGERLLARHPDRPLQRFRTRDGAGLPTAPLTLFWSDDALEGISRDLEWAATENGDALLKLTTGERLDTSQGHLAPCPANPAAPITVTALAVSPQGFVLGLADQTLERRNWDGSLRAARRVGQTCDVSGQPGWVLTLRDGVVGYRVRDGQPGEVKIGRWVEGGEPQPLASTRETAASLSFRSTFALGRPEAYLQLSKPDASGLRLGDRWTQAYEPPRFSVTARVNATYQNENRYGLRGTLETVGGTYDLQGTGTHSGAAGRIVFTQAICGIPPFAEPCPLTTWEAELRQDGRRVGFLSGRFLDPNRTQGRRMAQQGSLLVDLEGEGRFFDFELVPSTTP